MNRRRLSIFALLLGPLMAVNTTASATDCEPFPRVTLWGNYTHARVQRYVETRLKGDWDAYIKRLDDRQRAIGNLRDQGKPLVLKHKGKRVKLAGRQLTSYMKATARRLAVVRCLAAEDSGAAFQDFATAAGGNEPAPVIELASVRTGTLKVDIEGRCEAGDVTFKVSNLGKRWPKSGTIGIFRLGNGDPLKVSARHMRMNNGQSATFKVKASKNPTGRLGMWVEPSWEQRAFAFDATVDCG